jgi:hypothetical protein
MADPHTACQPLTCNLHAIPSSVRPAYRALTERVFTSVSEKRELPDGFAFVLRSGEVSLPEVAEWISMERLCCPFLTFELTTSGHETDWMLKLTGPSGVKELIEAELPA